MLNNRLKKFLFSIFILLLCGQIRAESFSAKITHVDATGFPVIEAILQTSSTDATEIEATDLILKENSSAIEKFSVVPQEFNHFMALTLDRSSSIENAMPDVKKAALKLVENLADEVSFSVISFGSDIDFNQSFTNNVASLTEAILKIRPWGGTALFDALYESVDELQAAAGLNDLKTIVCITDGHDSTPSGQHRLSQRTSDEVLRFALDKNIRIITLGLGDDIDEGFLSSIASETGGWYLKTAASDRLTRMCEELSRRIKLRKHFKVIFNSNDNQTSDKSRTLEVTVKKNNFHTTAERNFHLPARKSSVAAAVNEETESLSMEEILDYFEITGNLRAQIIGKIRIPAPTAVFGLTTAAFSGLSEVNARNLINQAQQRIAREHELNFQQQKSVIDEYISNIDAMLKHFYNEAEKSGLKKPRADKISTMLAFLELRREELELHQQKIYETYLIRFKASIDELAFFEKTQVANEKLSDDFFTTNNASCTASLTDLSQKTAGKMQVIEQKKQRFLAGRKNGSIETKPITEKGIDTEMPGLTNIKTID